MLLEMMAALMLVILLAAGLIFVLKVVAPALGITVAKDGLLNGLIFLGLFVLGGTVRHVKLMIRRLVVFIWGYGD